MNPSIEAEEQPVANVETFPSGGVTSVAPLNRDEAKKSERAPRNKAAPEPNNK